MCRSLADGGRRCPGFERWHVNREAHSRFVGDVDQERHWHKPTALLSMTPNAIRCRRVQMRRYAAEVEAVRTVHGVAADAPIGPVLREELWSERRHGAALSTAILADRFRAIVAEEGVPVAEVAARYADQQVRPSRMRAGERLADLATERADWVTPERLVSMVEPPTNGEPSLAYCRVVTDLEGDEYVLVSSYDGSEPMAWPHTAAGLKAAAWECLERVRAVDAGQYETWLTENDATQTDANPWTQTMTDADFLASSDGMHLT